MFSDEEDNELFQHNSLANHPDLSSKSNAGLLVSPSSVSSNSSFLQIIAASAASSPAAPLSPFADSIHSNQSADLFASSCESAKGFQTHEEIMEHQDSGYNTVPLEKSQLVKDFVPYKETRTSSALLGESQSSQVNLMDEAFEFLKKPSQSATFSPNLEYYEAKLIEAKVIPDIKKFVRRSLQIELAKMREMKSASQPSTEKAQDAECSLSERLEEELPSCSKMLTGQESPILFQSDDEDFEQNAKQSPQLSPSIFQHWVPEPKTTSSSEILVENPPTLPTCEAIIDENVMVRLSMEEIYNKPCTEKRRTFLINKIETLIKDFLQKIINGEPLEFMIRNIAVGSNLSMKANEILTLKTSQNCVMRRVSISDERSRFRFALIMFLLAEIYHFLLTKTSCTARELYYKDPEFVEDQINIGLGIKDICSLLEAAPWELGVFSSSKGLIAGSLIITLASGEDVDCSLLSGGILLPHETSGVKSLHSTAKYALIVEKDTVYEKLLQQDIFARLGRDIILITGKGFPDVNTRVILKKIATELRIPIYGLFDADPYGIEIFFVYRHGSRAMSFNSDNLACPSVKWIGIHPSEIELLGIPSMLLTADDKRRLESLLDRPYISDEMRRELLVLKNGNQKAEIEGVSSFSENYLLTEYIPNKIRRDFLL